MRYAKTHCDNCGELTIVMHTHGFGMDTSQCAKCRHADPEDDRENYEAEREQSDTNNRTNTVDSI